jgi:hypothetical protein
MAQYKIYYRDVLFAEVSDTSDIQYFRTFGIEFINFTKNELAITCPVEDVRVEREGVVLPLKVTASYLMGKKTTLTEVSLGASTSL